MQSKLLGAAIFLAILLAGCAHIEGTRDKSSTFQRSAQLRAVDSIAILPIKDDAGMPGLASKIESALAESLRSQFPDAMILDAQITASEMMSHGSISDYGQWRAGYEITGLIDPKALGFVASTISARYLLAVHTIHLTREKMRASDTGHAGWVNDVNNVWRTDLEFAAGLIDARSKQVAWKGDGHAEHIHSPKKSSDLFFVVINHRNPEMPEYVGEMVATATQGLAHQIAGGRAGASAEMVRAQPEPIAPPAPQDLAPAPRLSAAPPPPVLSSVPVPLPPTPTASVPPVVDTGATIRCPAMGINVTQLAVTALGGMDGMTGAMVTMVTPHSVAANAGIRQGDVLLRVGEFGINDPNDVQDAVALITPGSTIEVKLSRQARPVWVSVNF